MNAAPENSPESAHPAAPRPRRMRGWWLPPPARGAILRLAAFGWLPPYIALPAIVAVAPLMAVELRSASRGVAVDTAQRLVPAVADPTAGLVAFVNALPEP